MKPFRFFLRAIPTANEAFSAALFLCAAFLSGIGPATGAENPSRAILAQAAGSAVSPENAAETPSDSTIGRTPLSAAPVQLSAVREKKPSTIMYHSLWLPGWGQLDNGRKKKAALFIAGEIVCIGGYFYERNLLSDSGRTRYERDVIRMNRNTFVIYWLCAKLFGMVDAYVDAQFRDYDVRDVVPKDALGE